MACLCAYNVGGEELARIIRMSSDEYDCNIKPKAIESRCTRTYGVKYMQPAIEMTPQRRFALVVVLMAATLVQVLDTTIANVALPHMQASLGAAPDTISWVLTSYIVAAAVATPLTGWVETRIGQSALMSGSIIGFTMASVLCGLSNSLQMMVVARLVQGVFGAFITPLSQAVMLDIYSDKERPKAMSIWGMGIMIGPILGPVLGGVLTDAYNWRWVFFINVPIGIFAFLGILALMPRGKPPSAPFDTYGFIFLALGLGALQLVLDRGTQQDWLSSTEIIIEIATCIAMLWMFAVHTLTARNPLIPIELFRDRNFLLSNAFLFIVMGVLMSAAALLPPMLQVLFGYSTTDAGMLIMPRGISMMASMYIVGRLLSKIDARFLVMIGMLMVAASQWMMTGFSLEMDQKPVVISGLLQGFGFGFVMIPLNLLAFSTISQRVRTSAAAVWSLSRNIGGSIAISMFSALSARNLQVSHSDLTSHLTTVRFPFFEAGLIERLGVPSGAVLRMIDEQINRQAMMISYLDNFWLMSVLTFAMLPLAFFLRARKPGGDLSDAMMIE